MNCNCFIGAARPRPLERSTICAMNDWMSDDRNGQLIITNHVKVNCRLESHKFHPTNWILPKMKQLAILTLARVNDTHARIRQWENVIRTECSSKLNFVRYKRGRWRAKIFRKREQFLCCATHHHHQRPTNEFSLLFLFSPLDSGLCQFMINVRLFKSIFLLAELTLCRI